MAERFEHDAEWIDEIGEIVVGGDFIAADLVYFDEEGLLDFGMEGQHNQGVEYRVCTAIRFVHVEGYVVSCPAMRKMNVLPMISVSFNTPSSLASAEFLISALIKFCPSLSLPIFFSRSSKSRINPPNSS